MKRRLRKKRRLGEFREDCFAVHFQIADTLSPLECDHVVDRFIGMIEASGLQFGGGGIHDWSGVVEFCGRGTANQQHQVVVLQWLRQQREIVASSVGELKDAWHGYG